jgi:alpha-amylase/alpha-mannosidase (GH57 family)
MARLLCLHGHFYQPPRENPWIEEIETQDSAEPFHDWNERIAAECYGPNGAARIKTAGDRIVDIVDNYLHLSFNFGPTLLAWLERFRPDAYASVLEADAQSVAKRGHGNALAQGYSHAILPLASPRDRVTQIRWGIADFRHRFGRDPEGFWLPETAADSATLEAVAGEGIRFTILSPYQARRVRPPDGEWHDATDAKFDPTRPYRVRAGDREIVVFFYDGHIARDLAFGAALASPDGLAKRLEGGFDPDRGHDEILTVAIDGETLGHHKKGGDETLAAAMRALSRSDEVEIVNLGQALDRIPVEWEAQIAEKTSWSCAHGVERWRSDCGCQAGGEPDWKQAWRAPLLAALEALRDRLAANYEAGMAPFVPDPWATRDRFIELVLDPERRQAAEFLRREAGRALSRDEVVKALRLLEMERQSLLMFTSCGWFFAEISGIETVQVMKYAARAIQLARDAEGEDLEPGFEAALARAPSNLRDVGDGRRAYETFVRPSVVTLEGIAAHLAISSAARETPEKGLVFCYRYEIGSRRVATSPPATLTLSRVQLESATTRETLDALCCVLHLGAADFRCGVAPWRGPEHLAEVEAVLLAKLERAGFSRVLREIDRFFPGRDYALRDLFLDERRRVAAALLDGMLRRYEAHYREIFDDNLRLMEFLREIDSPIPGPIRVAADVTLSGRLLDLSARTRAGEVSLADAEEELGAISALARRLGAHLHLEPVRWGVEALVRERLADLQAGRAAELRAREAAEILAAVERVGLRLDLWEAQNRLWAWAGAPATKLDRDAAAELARLLWFHPAALLLRAGYEPAPEPVFPASPPSPAPP